MAIGANEVNILVKARDEASGVLSGVSASAKRMERNLRPMGMVAGAALAGIGVAAVKMAADFDSAMTKSLAIMGDVSDAMRKDMADAARQVAKDTTFSASQAADAYFYLASAGLSAEQSLKAMPQVAQFAQAGMFDMALATDLLTDAQSALGLTVDDTIANMENMARVSDVLVKANTMANATVEQFSTALTTEAGAAMKSFGIDVEEGVAVLAAFADQGVKGQVAGTGLSRILRLMTSAAVNNADAYRELGVSIFDAQGNIRNLADIIANLEQALGGMSDAQRTAALEALGFQARVQGVILPLLGTSDAIREYEQGLRVAGGTTKEVADKQLQTFSAQLMLAMHALQDIAITIGMALLPKLTTMVKGIAAASEYLKEHKTLALALGVAIGTVLVGAFAAWAISAAIAAAATVAAVWPVLAIIAAVAGLSAGILLLVKNWDAVWGAMKAAPAALLAWFKAHFVDVLLFFMGPLGITAIIIRNWKAIWALMPDPVRGAMNAVAGIVERAINWILDRLNDLIRGINAFVKGANSILGKLSFGNLAVPEIPEITARANFQMEAATKPVVEGVRNLTLAAQNFKRSSDSALPAIEDLMAGLDDAAASADGAGGAAAEAAAAIDILEDGIISLKEAQEKGIPAWAAARFEMEAAAKVAEEELAEGAWRTQVELSKLAHTLGDQGVTAEAFAFQTMIGVLSGELQNTGLKLEEFISDGVISLKEALDLGLNPAQAAAIELTRERFQAEQEAADAAFRGNVELIKLADALGEAGISGAAFRAAHAVELAKEALEETQQALNALFGRPTKEGIGLELEQAQLELERLMAAQGGASDEYLAALDEQIKKIGEEIAILDKRHQIMQLEATLADQTLLTERELKTASDLLTQQIRIQSANVVKAAQEAQRFSEVAKGFADYQFWLGRRIGDAAEIEIRAHHNLANAASQAAAVLFAIKTPAGYQGGTAYVPATGLYQLHRGEAVIPAGANRRGGGSTTIDNRNFGRQNFIFPNVDPRGAMREMDRRLRGM